MFSISRCTQVCINKQNLMYKPINSITLCSCHSTTYIWIFFFKFVLVLHAFFMVPFSASSARNHLPSLRCSALAKYFNFAHFVLCSVHSLAWERFHIFLQTFESAFAVFFFSPLTELGSSFTITWDVRSTFYSEGKWQPLQRTSNTNRSVPY